MKKSTIQWCLGLPLILATLVQAQGRPSGLRVTVTDVDGPSGVVSFDVTLNTVEVYGVPTLTTPTGLLGDYIFTEFYATTYPPGFTGQLLSPVVPALDHGATTVAGNIVDRSKIPLVAPGTYRGSFSFTYPGNGPYNLKAATSAMMSLGTTAAPTITTGTAITNPSQYPTGGGNSFLGSWVGRSFFGGSLTYNLVGPDTNPPFVWGVENSTTVVFGSIGDTVWCDGEVGTGNGSFDPGEGVAGVTVRLFDDADCDDLADGPSIDSQATVGDGQYLFERLSLGIPASPACYVVEVDSADPALGACVVPLPPTNPTPDLDTGAPEVLDSDFGFVQPVGSVGDTVWCDGLEGTGNGGFDPGEGLAGIGVDLFEDTNCDNLGDGPAIANTATAGDGQYLFSGLSVGPSGSPVCYEVEVDATDPDLGTCTIPITATEWAPKLEIGAIDSLVNDFGFEVPCVDLDNDNLCNESCTEDRDGDGDPDCTDYDPQGYFYCESTGDILGGGSIDVQGPGAINIIEDGSSGRYAFLTDGTAGTYTLVVTPPDGFPQSSACLDQGTLDPTGQPDPLMLGAGEDLSSGNLVSPNCSDNPFYLTFELEAGDPMVINNNLPLASCGIVEIPTTSHTGLALIALLLTAVGVFILRFRLRGSA